MKTKFQVGDPVVWFTHRSPLEGTITSMDPDSGNCEVAFNIGGSCSLPQTELTPKNPDPIPNEPRKVGFHGDYEMWAILGEKSGHCYGQFMSEYEADEALNLYSQFYPQPKVAP